MSCQACLFKAHSAAACFPWPRDQFSAASQLKKFPKTGTTAGTFLMATPDCRAVLPNKSFTLLRPRLIFSFSMRPYSAIDFLAAAASDPGPYEIRAASTEGSVYRSSTPASM
eukprot:365398-Chlamydomonas_euryale.AAC.1